VFTWDGTKSLTKNNVAASKFCDGEYTVKITAQHPDFTGVEATYTATVVLKYDCLSLINAGLYAVPTNKSLVKWPNKDQSKETSTNSISYTIEDTKADFTHPLVHPTKTYSFSCSV
jgi:hypothetical protein